MEGPEGARCVVWKEIKREGTDRNNINDWVTVNGVTMGKKMQHEGWVILTQGSYKVGCGTEEWMETVV